MEGHSTPKIYSVCPPSVARSDVAPIRQPLHRLNPHEINWKHGVSAVQRLISKSSFIPIFHVLYMTLLSADIPKLRK